MDKPLPNNNDQNTDQNSDSSNEQQFWAAVRAQSLIPADEAYFNTGTIGATPRPVIDAVADHMRNLARTLNHWDYSETTPHWISGYSTQLQLRDRLATLINAESNEIALTQNATMAMNLIGHGLDLVAGDEVLTTDQEHPGGRSIWEMLAARRGTILRTLTLPYPAVASKSIIRLFAQAITERTRVISIAHITSRHGIRLPVAEICALAAERNIFTVVDGAQAVGQLQVDVRAIGCDAYLASPHKWLLAPPGNGFLFIKASALPRIWTTLASENWQDEQQGAFRLMQYGTGNLSLLTGLAVALDLYDQIGRERIYARIANLAARLRAGLVTISGIRLFSPVVPELSSALISYGLAGYRGRQLQDQLWQQRKIRIRAFGDEDVRQSVHIYNSEAEIDATLEILAKLAQKSST